MTDVLEVVDERGIALTDTLGGKQGVSFMALERGMCRFPLGGPRDPPTMFCGEAAEPGQSYCPACHARAYWKPRSAK